MKNTFDHCFAICAYKNSPYLEDCIASLLSQDTPSKIIIATSTPNDYIGSVAQKHGIPLFVNPVSRGIAGDWNFAYRQADAQYVTIAHQDDTYLKDYAKMICESISGPDALIFFTDYYEISGDTVIKENRLLKTKERMNFPLRLRTFQKSRFVRKRILSLGSSICCPSVTFHKPLLGDFSFDDSFSCDLDWDAWSRIAEMKGAFVYIHRPLMCHRIHEQSETTKLLDNGVRFEEDLRIFKRYWPNAIARLIMRYYSKSARSNQK